MEVYLNKQHDNKHELALIRLRHVSGIEKELKAIAGLLKTDLFGVCERIKKLLEHEEEMKKEIERLKGLLDER